MTALTRSHRLPFGYVVEFEWVPEPRNVKVTWSSPPHIRTRKAQRRFFEAYAAVRTQFLTEVAHLTGLKIMVADPAIDRTEMIERPTIQ